MQRRTDGRGGAGYGEGLSCLGDGLHAVAPIHGVVVDDLEFEAERLLVAQRRHYDWAGS